METVERLLCRRNGPQPLAQAAFVERLAAAITCTLRHSAVKIVAIADRAFYRVLVLPTSACNCSIRGREIPLEDVFEVRAHAALELPA